MKILFFFTLCCAIPLTAGGVVVNSFDAPGSSITGLALAGGVLYAVSSTGTMYRLDPYTGELYGSSSVVSNANGVGYAGNLLYVTNGTYNIYKYDSGGAGQGITTLYCVS